VIGILGKLLPLTGHHLTPPIIFWSGIKLLLCVCHEHAYCIGGALLLMMLDHKLYANDAYAYTTMMGCRKFRTLTLSYQLAFRRWSLTLTLTLVLSS